ncbi:MAG: hypothetical protein JJU05_15820 [Verrucomicrobia bacterium]|nr:hypothetical protein [Verrucomicrobiota bacterium]MCH8528226.1 hypothetical protein [Kiritimatiellia bacterium]
MLKSVCFTLLCLLPGGILPAQIWQFPGEAVEDLTRLTLEELFERWDPAPLSETEPAEPGEYVEYRHETLVYFFGPYPDEETARQAQETLDGIREILIQRDAKFQTSRIQRHHRPGAPGSAARESTPEPSPPPPIPSDPDEIPPAPAESPGPASSPAAFWISALSILAVSGWLLWKT